MRNTGDVERIIERHEPRIRRLFTERPHVARRLIVPQLARPIEAKLTIEFDKVAQIKLRTVGPDA